MRTLFFISLLTVFSVASCSDDNDQGIFQENFAGSYSYTVMISCYCSSDYVGPNAIVLEDGVVTKLNGHDVEIGQSDYDLAQSLGLDDLTLRAETIIDNEPFEMSVEYHPTYGFIDDCYFDIDENWIDEEWGYTITDFKVL